MYTKCRNRTGRLSEIEDKDKIYVKILAEIKKDLDLAQVL